MDKTGLHKKAMLVALESNLGNVTEACKEAGVGRSTHYLWINEDEDYKKQVDSIKEIEIDFVESELKKQIKQGNSTATIFFLKTQAKHRGYVEKQEISHEGTIQWNEVRNGKPDIQTD
jgi:uncharacterized protein YxeA